MSDTRPTIYLGGSGISVDGLIVLAGVVAEYRPRRYA